MGKGRRLLDQLALGTELAGESIPAQPIVEIAGDGRVLIENHYGVRAYSQDAIVVNVKYGCVCVSGKGLELLCMTKEQLVIRGKIDAVTLQRRR